MKICVFCSASENIDAKFLANGSAFGRELGRRGHELIYGGYSRGLMARVAMGAKELGAPVTAVVPAIFDNPSFIYSGCTRVIRTADLHSRKAAMQREADAFAVLQGGVGTYDELFDTLALVASGQTRKPIAVLDADGFFAPLRRLLDDGAACGFIDANTAGAVSFCPTAAELLDCLERAALCALSDTGGTQ